MATKTLDELLAEQATIDSYYSAAAGKWAAGEFDPTDVVTLLERAEQAESNAENSANVASTAAGLATTAKTAAETAKTDAVAAKTDAETASGVAADAKDAAESAKDAAVTASEEAVEKVANAAQVNANNEFTGNNTFSATSTFNGALVANDSLLAVGSLEYKSQELNDLLSYPIVAQLMAAGINPASALATTWDQWVSMNPNWRELDDLLFYAPLITGSVGTGLPTNVDAPDKSCTFISPAIARSVASAYMFGRHIKYFTWRGDINGEVFDCYKAKDCDFYAPNATKLTSALNAIGFLNSSAELSLNVYVPLVKTLSTYDEQNVNATFWRIGLLKSFSIYAPELKTSFTFSRATNQRNADGSTKGQTCAILQALIDGIGTPTTEQTITTVLPSDGDEIAEGEEKTKKDKLREAAATKKWKFLIFEGKDADGNDIITDL